MKRMIALFIFAVLISSNLAFAKEIGQTAVATPKNYVLNDCIALENNLNQKISETSFGLASGPSMFGLLMMAPGVVGALGTAGAAGFMIASGVVSVVPVSIVVIGVGMMAYSIRMVMAGSDIAQIKKNISACYGYIARASENAALCEKIVIANERNSCYGEIAVKTNNPSLCEKTKWQTNNAAEWDLCYYKLAIKRNDLSLCEKLSGPRFVENALYALCVETISGK